MCSLRAGIYFLGLSLVAAPSNRVAPSAALRFDCDSRVETQASDPLRYRQRGDRCEGVYEQNVSGSSDLRVASLVESLEAFDDNSSLPLLVEWTPPAGEAVSLRASAIRAGLYYRMETLHPIAASSFTWPADVRRPLGISSADVGVTGTASMSIGGSRHEVLVPLRITQSHAATRSSSYRLTLWPTIELNDMYLTVAATDDNGNPTRYLRRDVRLGYGYPAERPVVVRLPALSAPGVYLVRIAAIRAGGGGVTRSVLLYHAGTRPPSAS